MFNTIKKNVRSAWLRYQLNQLDGQQIAIDQLVADRKKETEQLVELHKKTTDQLARERTSIRTQLVRL